MSWSVSQSGIPSEVRETVKSCLEAYSMSIPEEQSVLDEAKNFLDKTLANIADTKTVSVSAFGSASLSYKDVDGVAVVDKVTNNTAQIALAITEP